MIPDQSFHRALNDRSEPDTQVESNLFQYRLIVPGNRTGQMNRQIKIIVLLHIPGKECQEAAGHQLPDSRLIQMFQNKRRETGQETVRERLTGTPCP